jgi:hypothetical protein
MDDLTGKKIGKRLVLGPAPRKTTWWSVVGNAMQVKVICLPTTNGCNSPK